MIPTKTFSFSLPYLFSTENPWWALLLVLLALWGLGFILSKNTPSVNINQRAAVPVKVAQKPIVPVVQPKALAPKIVKLDAPAPTLEPKALIVALPEPVVSVQETAPVAKEEVVVAAPAPAPAVEQAQPQEQATKAETIDDTFEAYRQAMLASGPRQMEIESRAEMQSKNGPANNSVWREQVSSLRQSLKEESAAEFLERTNTSINDRMVAIFDSVKA